MFFSKPSEKHTAKTRKVGSLFEEDSLRAQSLAGVSHNNSALAPDSKKPPKGSLFVAWCPGPDLNRHDVFIDGF